MNTWLRAISFPLIAVLFLSHCTSHGDGASGDSQQAGALAGTAPSQDGINTPERIIRAGGQEIPVYEDFTRLAPIFEKNNDTTYIINFWATWCKPCVEELPYFEQLHEQFAGEKIRVILVSLDFERDLNTKLTRFVEENQLKSEVIVLLDGNYNEWIDKVDPAWGGAIPVTLVYQAADRHFIGQQLASYQELKGIIASLL